MDIYIIGIILSPFFIEVGIMLFLGVVMFKIVTLPVEINASKRALVELENGISPKEKLQPDNSMLNVAALTYIVATLVDISQFLRLISMSSRRR